MISSEIMSFFGSLERTSPLCSMVDRKGCQFGPNWWWRNKCRFETWCTIWHLIFLSLHCVIQWASRLCESTHRQRSWLFHCKEQWSYPRWMFYDIVSKWNDFWVLVAAEKGNLDVLEFLESKGADLSTPTNSGKTTRNIQFFIFCEWHDFKWFDEFIGQLGMDISIVFDGW